MHIAPSEIDKAELCSVYPIWKTKSAYELVVNHNSVKKDSKSKDSVLSQSALWKKYFEKIKCQSK